MMIRTLALSLLILKSTFAYSQTSAPQTQLIPSELQEQKKELQKQLEVLLQYSLKTLKNQQTVCEQIKTLKDQSPQEAKQRSYQDCQKELDQLALTVAKLRSKIKALNSN
jgi:hypothetical protein